MDGNGEGNLMDQLDDFDHNMMDEANVNCPDDQIMNYNGGNNYNQY